MDVVDRPWVVCLCGSLRFADLFEAERRRLTAEGVIVLGPEPVDGELTATLRAALGVLHLRRIDLADEVRVLSAGGCVGESTRREIAYARRQGKVVSALEPTLDLERLSLGDEEGDGSRGRWSRHVVTFAASVLMACLSVGSGYVFAAPEWTDPSVPYWTAGGACLGLTLAVVLGHLFVRRRRNVVVVWIGFLTGMVPPLSGSDALWIVAALMFAALAAGWIWGVNFLTIRVARGSGRPRTRSAVRDPW